MNATLESVLSFEGNDTNGTLMDRYDPVSTQSRCFNFIWGLFLLIIQLLAWNLYSYVRESSTQKSIEIVFFLFAQELTVHFSYSK